jgi:hypothetical protein
MDLQELKKEYPNLIRKFNLDDIDDIRSIIVVDENYEDEDEEDSVEFDWDEYNYMVYLPEMTLKAVGSETIQSVLQKLSNSSIFDDFLVSEVDLFGVLSDLNTDSIAKIVLSFIEQELSC